VLDTNLNNEINGDNYQATEPQKKPNIILSSSLATILMIALLAVASVSSYAPIKDKFMFTENHIEAYIESDNFIFTLVGLTHYLNQSNLQNNNWYNHKYETLENIKYYINSTDNTFSKSNIADVTDEILQQEMENSQFYLQAKFDMEGNPEIKNSLDNNANIAFLNVLGVNRNASDGVFADFADLNIIYLIPQDISGANDLFTRNMKEFHIGSYVLLILAIGAVSISALTIIAISIPYSVQSRLAICRLFNKMFLEFKLLILFGVGFVLLSTISVMKSYGTQALSVTVLDIIYDADLYFYLVGIPVTFMLFLFVYLSVVYIKYVYHVGFKEGFIKNNIPGIAGYYIVNKLNGLFHEALAIDLNKDGQKQLFVTLGINLIALWIIAITGFLGFMLAIAYTIFLFKYLIKQIAEAKAISDASSQLAAGDFAISLEENAGVFNPIAKNLNNIKDGFKLAVEKEIKSQRMKAELISNVSHDLKTPLTSIISYVDLLKKEDISKETQQEYIGILDQKSQRLKSLIEDLFEASKASSGNMELYLENVDVIALFRQTLGELEEKINQSTLQIKTNVPEKKIICALDGKRTYRIFENIISNILKYGMPNSRVYIDVLEDGEDVSFIFKNISSYEMNFDAAEITERFTRGDKSRNTEGSGLGLAITKSLIELQNGTLEINIDGDLFKLAVKFPKAD